MLHELDLAVSQCNHPPGKIFTRYVLTIYLLAKGWAIEANLLTLSPYFYRTPKTDHTRGPSIVSIRSEPREHWQKRSHNWSG